MRVDVLELLVGRPADDHVAGEVHATLISLVPTIPHVRAGRLRPLGITATRRSSLLPEVPAISATALKARFDAGDDIKVLDVRESHELAICKLDGAVPVPLTSLPNTIGDLDREGEYVVICRSGRRSAHAVRLLHEAGFHKVHILTGGLLAWSDEVDPSMPKY